MAKQPAGLFIKELLKIIQRIAGICYKTFFTTYSQQTFNRMIIGLITMIVQKTKNAELVCPAQHFFLCILRICDCKNAVSIGCAQNIKREINIFLVIVLSIIVIFAAIIKIFEFLIHFKIIFFFLAFFTSGS